MYQIIQSIQRRYKQRSNIHVLPLPINSISYDLFAKFNGACVGGPSGVTYAYLHNKSVLLDWD